MDIKFLGQGFNPELDDSVGYHLIRLLSEKEFNSFTWLSAFASEPGIRGLSLYIEQAKDFLTSMTIIVGIDQKGTSKEALEAILDLNVNAFVFYQPSSSIFHPKIYLFEGDKKSVLIVGSSNMTAQGLFTNVEASLLITFDCHESKDKETIAHLKTYFRGIFEQNDPNLKPLSLSLIEHLIELRIVPTEQERQELSDSLEKEEKLKTVSLLKSLFPSRAIPKIPSLFRSGKSPKKLTRKAADKKIGEIASEKSAILGKLVWRRRKLPASSVQASAQGTNPTGGLRLVQDEFTINGKTIDQTTYFRDVLFADFKWKTIRQKPVVEIAVVPFHVFIDEKYIGKFVLEVRHKPSGEAGQHNYTTSISWGDLGNIIRDANLTGAQLDIHASARKGNIFTMVFTRP